MSKIIQLSIFLLIALTNSTFSALNAINFDRSMLERAAASVAACLDSRNADDNFNKQKLPQPTTATAQQSELVKAEKARIAVDALTAQLKNLDERKEGVPDEVFQALKAVHDNAAAQAQSKHDQAACEKLAALKEAQEKTAAAIKELTQQDVSAQVAAAFKEEIKAAEKRAAEEAAAKATKNNPIKYIGCGALGLIIGFAAGEQYKGD